MKSELQEACEKYRITIESVHIGTNFDNTKYPNDKWSCVLSFKDRSEVFEFSTGIGHRVLALGVKKEGFTKWWDYKTSTYAFSVKEAIEKNFLILKKEKGKIIGPLAADVLSCILLDASACNMSFANWSSDLGVTEDSRQSLENYLLCQQNGDKVYRLLGSAIVEELSGMSH